MKMRCVFLVSIILLGMNGVIFASPENASPQDRTLSDEIVVTATRYDENTSNIPAVVTVIDSKDIESMSAYHIPDLLRTVAGLHVTDVNGNRRNYRVDIRGFGETAHSNTLVLIDGRRINQADLSGTDWTLIPVDRVERIEIIRGGQGGVLYGDNTTGGVINIITKKGRRFSAGVKMSAGSYDTYKTGGYVSGRKKDFSYALAGSYANSDGYRDNSDAEVRDFGLRLGYETSHIFDIALDGGYHKDMTHLPGAIKATDYAAGLSRTDSLNPDDFADTEDYYISAIPHLDFSNNCYLKIEMSFRKREVFQFSSFTGGTFDANTEIETKIFSPQLIFMNKLGGMPNNLTIGSDFCSAEEDVYNSLVFTGWPASVGIFTLKKVNTGYYLHDELKMTDRLIFSGGYRYDRARFEFEPSTPDHTTMDEDLFTSGVSYHINNSARMFLSFSKSLRYPVLDEIFNFTTNSIDLSLVPQTSLDYEVGIQGNISDTVTGTVTIFRIDTKDEIFLNPITYANENLDGDTRREGIEISLSKSFPRWSISGSYSYTQATLDDSTYDDKTVPGVPKHKATIDTRFKLCDYLSLSLTGNYIGERYFESDFANDFQKQEDHFVSNARFFYERGNISAYLNINNLFNEEYSEYGVLGGWPTERAWYPSPEFNLLAGISISY